MFRKRNKLIKNANKYLSITSGGFCSPELLAGCQKSVYLPNSLCSLAHWMLIKMQILHRNLKPLAYFSTCSNLMLTILYFHHLTCSLVYWAQAFWNLLVMPQIQWEALFPAPQIMECIIVLLKFALFCWWKYSWNTSTQVALCVYLQQ